MGKNSIKLEKTKNSRILWKKKPAIIVMSSQKNNNSDWGLSDVKLVDTE